MNEVVAILAIALVVVAILGFTFTRMERNKNIELKYDDKLKESRDEAEAMPDQALSDALHDKLRSRPKKG